MTSLTNGRWDLLSGFSTLLLIAVFVTLAIPGFSRGLANLLYANSVAVGVLWRKQAEAWTAYAREFRQARREAGTD
jgi:hypothetical protein